MLCIPRLPLKSARFVGRTGGVKCKEVIEVLEVSIIPNLIESYDRKMTWHSKATPTQQDPTESLLESNGEAHSLEASNVGFMAQHILLSGY